MRRSASDPELWTVWEASLRTIGAQGMLVLSWARISSVTSALARLPPPRSCCAAPFSSCLSMGSRSSADSCSQARKGSEAGPPFLLAYTLGGA